MRSPQVSAAELAVVIPVYNEAANIAAVLEEWFSCLRIVCPNFILFAINDGSKDETAQVLEPLQNQLGDRFRLINKTNSGHGLTCREGYELALAEGVEWIFQIDSDGQCDPAFFPSFYTHREECDGVFGYRRTRDEFIELLEQLFTKVAYPKSAEFFHGLEINFAKETITGQRATVKTTVRHPKEGSVSVDYRLAQEGGVWRVQDILLDDVSLAANLQSQFNKIITENSYAELLRRMRDKLNE